MVTDRMDFNKMRELDIGMSNFDHRIDDGLAEALRAEPGKVCAHHSAWDFCGYTYYVDGEFHTQVWVYGTPRETISAATLEDLMKATNDKYGWD